VADEAEYAFLHVLVRDVAYGQIPRAQRAERHRRAAEWITSLGRTEDHPEMLAHHYLSALELRRASGQPADASLAQQALESLRAAGDRAVALNAYATAAAYYQSAMDLASSDSPERARLLFQLGRARYIAGDVEPDLLAAACDALLACSDREGAAEAEASLSLLYSMRGEQDRASGHLNRAREQIEDREPSRAKAYVLSHVARSLLRASANEEAIDVGREALHIADQLALDDGLRAHILQDIGQSRLECGDADGLADLEQSVAIALAADNPDMVCRSKGNLAGALWELGQLERADALDEEALQTASRFGLIANERWFRAELVFTQFGLGRWAEALAGADPLLAEVEAGSPHILAMMCYFVRSHIRLGHDDIPGAVADAERALDIARLAKDPFNLFFIEAQCAYVFWESGDVERAALLAGEFLADLQARRRLHPARVAMHVLAWTLSRLGRGQELIDAIPSAVPWVDAALAFAAGDLSEAADICGAMGALAEEARDRLWLAEALVKQSRRAEADVHLHRALAFYRSVDATRYIRMGEALFAASA
jgi:tetratricopeptide (TPR) repeat protein